MVSELFIGQRVYYVLPKGYGRVRALWLRASVRKVTPKRVTIVTDAYPYPRVTKAANLHTTDPPADVDVR